jgi:hypothetical protein
MRWFNVLRLRLIKAKGNRLEQRLRDLEKDGASEQVRRNTAEKLSKMSRTAQRLSNKL